MINDINNRLAAAGEGENAPSAAAFAPLAATGGHVSQAASKERQPLTDDVRRREIRSTVRTVAAGKGPGVSPNASRSWTPLPDDESLAEWEDCIPDIVDAALAELANATLVACSTKA